MTAFSDLFVNIDDFASEALAFAHCASNTGLTLYSTGGTYDFDGLTFPHATRLYCTHPNKVSATGELTLPNSQGVTIEGWTFERMVLSNARNCIIRNNEFLNTTADAAMVVTGTSYYNVIDRNEWNVQYGVEVGGPDGGDGNSNTFINNRMNSSTWHMKWVRPGGPGGHGWNIFFNAFEGVPPDGGCGEVLIHGHSHVIVGNWFERGGSNHWPTAALQLASTTADCTVISGRRGYLYSVLNEGQNNFIDNEFAVADYNFCNPNNFRIVRLPPGTQPD